MINRFQGPDGERHLVTALQNCVLVEHNEELAKRLAKAGQIVGFEAGNKIIEQRADDNDVYFLIVGEADVLVNNRHVAIRKAGDSIGEMAALHPSRPRSATVSARTFVVTLKVTEPDFHQLAKEFPHVWRAVAQIVTERLDQRSALLNAPNQLPILFIGCSTEGLEVARGIELGLKHDDVNVILWTDGVFGPSGVPVDDLLRTVKDSDFAVFVFSPDDMVVSRGSEYNAPRDNVVFELGLFMGQLERKRTFVIMEQHSDVKVPTDMLGITPLTYNSHKGDLSTALGTVCTELRRVIKEMGVR